jgi:hypothetical protein
MSEVIVVRAVQPTPINVVLDSPALAGAEQRAANEVAAERSARETADTTERTRAEAAEATKASKTELGEETTSRQAGDAAEQARAEGVESTKATKGELVAEGESRLNADAAEKLAREAADALLLPLSQKGAASGVASLDGEGHLPTSQLPPLALTDPFVVNSEAAQLSLGAHKGDFAIRTDIGRTFVHNGGTSGTMADWIELVTPGDVQSVNGKTGVVYLIPADVGADPAGSATAEQTRAEGVEVTKATKGELQIEREGREVADGLRQLLSQKDVANGYPGLDSGGLLKLSEMPSSVLTSVTKEHGSVEGEQTPNLSEGHVHLYIAKGAFVLGKPINWPAGTTYAEVVIKQDATGGRAITLSGMTWINGVPVLDTSPNAVTAIQLVSWDGGTSVYALGVAEGKTGSTGPTGTEGFNPGKVLLPSAWPIYLKNNEGATENRAVVAEPYPRYVANTGILLTSGTPIGCAIPVPPKTRITGFACGVKTVEGTAANRTHLWGVLLDSAGKVLRRTQDYTSASTNPMNSSTRRGFSFTEAYETGESPVVLYVLLCEVMSNTNPVTLICKSGEQALTEGAPNLMVIGPAGQTGPPEVGATLALSGTFNEPWFGLV